MVFSYSQLSISLNGGMVEIIEASVRLSHLLLKVAMAIEILGFFILFPFFLWQLSLAT